MAFGSTSIAFLKFSSAWSGWLERNSKERQQEVGLRAFWVVRNALLYLFYGFGNIVLRGVVIGPRLVRFRIVGLLIPQNIEVSLGLLETVRRGTTVGVSCGYQQIGKIGAGAIVIGCEVNTAVEFLKGAGPVSQFEVGLAKLIMCLGKAGVDLDGIAILDFRLAVFALGEIFFAAVEVLLLAHVRITGTTERRDEKRTSQKQTHGNETTHMGLSSFGWARHTKAYLRTISHDTAPITSWKQLLESYVQGRSEKHFSGECRFGVRGRHRRQTEEVVAARHRQFHPVIEA